MPSVTPQSMEGSVFNLSSIKKPGLLVAIICASLAILYVNRAHFFYAAKHWQMSLLIVGLVAVTVFASYQKRRAQYNRVIDQILISLSRQRGPLSRDDLAHGLPDVLVTHALEHLVDEGLLIEVEPMRYAIKTQLN